MRKILHIISQYPGKTGSGIYINELIKQGNKKGYTQGLIAALPKDERYINNSIQKFYPVIFNTRDLPFPIVGMSDTMPYESTKYGDMDEKMLNQWIDKFTEVIQTAIGEFKPDIIISHHLWILTSLVKKMNPHIKTMALCHGTDIRQFEKNSKYREFVLEGCGQVDIVLSLNPQQKELIHNIYSIPKDRIAIIGGGYNDEIFFPPKNKKKDHKIKLVYGGKLSYAKGVLSLIKAYNMLDLDKDEIELQISGSGAGEGEEIIKKTGACSRLNVKFLGELPQSELGEVFRQSDIFVLPSFYEGLSLVTIEALASGLLVVATKHPGLNGFLGEIINNSGIIEYVDLPRMKNVDMPLEGELFDYENRLKKGIEKQIARFRSGFEIDKEIREQINVLSWGNIYNSIDKLF